MSGRGGKLIGARPNAPADRWVGAGREAATAPAKGEIFTARLTIDVTPVLRGRIKMAAFAQGVTVADMLRALLDERFGAAPGDASGARP